MAIESPTVIACETPEPLIRSRAGEGLRYLVASVAALALDAAVLAIAVDGFGLAPWFGGAIAYLVGLVFIYALSVRWVFAERSLRDPRGEFLAFAALGLVGLLLNSAVLQAATAAGLALPFAKALSAGIGFVANFVSRKVLLFSKGSR